MELRISSVWLCALAFGSTGGKDFLSPDLASLSLPDPAFLLVDTSTSLSYLTKDFTGGIIVSRVTLEQVGYKRKLSTHQLERRFCWLKGGMSVCGSERGAVKGSASSLRRWLRQQNSTDCAAVCRRLLHGDGKTTPT